MGEEKKKVAKVTIDHNLEDQVRTKKVEVAVEVAGGRGQAPDTGALSLDNLKSGGYIRQRQKDQFTVRCRVPGGRATSEWLRGVADAAEKYGKGLVHLSFRQSLEILYVDYKNFTGVTDTLTAHGVKVASCGPRVRVPTACGGCEYNPNGLTDTQAMASLVDKEFFGTPMAHKFKISFSGCPIDCARTNDMDLGFQGAAFPSWDEPSCTGCTVCSYACSEGAIEADAETGKPIFHEDKCLFCSDCIRACPVESWKARNTGWIVRVGGRHGRHPHNGVVIAWFVTDAMIPGIIKAITDWYAKHGEGRGRTRIGDLLKEPGSMDSLLDAVAPVVGDKLVRSGKVPEPIVIHDFPAGKPPVTQ